ncbi:fimbria/pilus outer membrane usher protein [Duganella violaceipulchra]|uniref:Outer membrane usher protein n=1 Tax=Duganella violaceipulchra TaxID=2849652 RepID=A0AA41H9M9_9BURK|nr:fimbria/pilus outer membrane usher protein [Duganella violaceicalia]MBV6322441.1 fimbrial biogenesis outer membrane usher protein [Duganella violaceicalia]MCP2010645.1 outer membrane usher protein [Duganella violaceicalia]
MTEPGIDGRLTTTTSDFMQNKKPPSPRAGHVRTRGCAAILGAFVSYAPLAALADSPPASVQFNPEFLMKSPSGTVDVARFSRSNPVAPGEYLVDLYINGSWAGRKSVRFAATRADDNATPRFNKALIERLGLDYATLSDKSRAELAKAQAGDSVTLSALVDGATTHFDSSDLRLDVSVPQIALLRHAQGYVSPEFWDEGVPSGTLAYDANTYRSTTPGGDSTSNNYLRLRSGLNIGSWHFRHAAALQTQSDGQRSFHSIESYLQHDLPSLQSQLTLGDAYTDGAVFDSVGLRGIALGSDDRMLPDSLRGYAPQIRGVAQTNARVTVTQNGVTLYETTVAPGAFEIDDLYATGYGGNLTVTVAEADGNKHNFTVPFASVAQLLRPGTMRYNIAAGQLRNDHQGSADKVLQFTLQRGINNTITGYVGAIMAEHYWAVLGGAALNTPLGAVAADLTQANATIGGVENTLGQSLRLRYSKLLPTSRTNLTLAAYRYSSSGYWGLSDATAARDLLAAGQDIRAVDRQRNQLQLTLSQPLGDRSGNLYLQGASSNYWNRTGSFTNFNIGYNNSLRAFGRDVSYSVSLTRQHDQLNGGADNRVYAQLSLPLGRGEHASSLSMSLTQDKRGMASQTVLTGTAGYDNAFSYGLTGNRDTDSSTLGLNGQYRSAYATLSASASRGAGYSQLSAGASGALVVHPGGVTLANDIGDTVGIVEARDAKGARVANAAGVHIDGRGYAVIPYLTPYSLNTVEIDPKGIPLEVEFKSTSEQVAPRANSVVMVHFGTVTGRAALITVARQDGMPLPFGASVFDAEGAEVGTVGQGSRAFVHGIAERGFLTANWGKAAGESCTFAYAIPPKGKKPAAYAHFTVVCIAPRLASVAQPPAAHVPTAVAPHDPATGIAMPTSSRGAKPE